VKFGGEIRPSEEKDLRLQFFRKETFVTMIQDKV
jgi:hypothetical protein